VRIAVKEFIKQMGTCELYTVQSLHPSS
jgi:hypothetical protein